ncbi:MAG: AAA family ATPase [Pseudobdellovibrionaceae bacterium]|jgi:putative DNA primase/helicase|nr:AAA family ATPase [Pseudobdellovibrionaceae bacterium]
MTEPSVILEVLDQVEACDPKRVLKSYTLGDFLRLEIPPREDILSPILQTQSLSMIYAKRGVGKTHFALNIAYALACGGSFLKWSAPRPCKVLYIDGEMPAHAMQERLAKIVKESGLKADPECFQIITPDMQDNGMPDISTLEGQEMIEPFVDQAEFIVVDNISTLARTGKENEAEGWLPIQAWALSLRSRKKSVMFVHHAGKGGQQRGTSRREDVLDLVIELKHPDDYKADDGARFEVHFVKARHLAGGPAAQSFEAQLGADGWSYRNIEDTDLKQVMALKKDGLSYREIEKEIGISKARAQRMVKGYEEKP